MVVPASPGRSLSFVVHFREYRPDEVILPPTLALTVYWKDCVSSAMYDSAPIILGRSTSFVVLVLSSQVSSINFRALYQAS